MKRRHTSRRLAVALAAIAIAGAGAWWSMARRGDSAPPGLPRARHHVLVVTLDTTRADRLGSYGYAAARTRYMDRLAAEGVRFDQAISPAPLTLPAHATLFTGLYPFEHGVRNNGNFYLADRFDTLAARLKQEGYRTGAFVSSFILDRRYGLARGFDVYDDRLEGATRQVISLEAERRGDRTALALGAWLDRIAAAAGGPFFAWLHLYDPHEPYRAPSPFRDAFPDSPYDGEVAFADSIVASVLDRLGRLGLLNDTVVVVVGDHGESLGEHGEETHSMFVYESDLRVPLILWRPGTLPAGVVVREPVRLTDLAPTLLDLVGAPPLPTASGRTLAPAIAGARAEPPAVYAETLLPQFYMGWAPLRSIRDERWKFIEAPRPELYDLERDPGEMRNLYEAEPQRATALRRALERMTGGAAGEMTVGAMDREALEKLASLGYVGAGPSPSAPASSQAVDPKDKIEVFNRLRRANSAVRERRFTDAMKILDDVLRHEPRNGFARLVLGSAYMGQGQYARAIEQYREYLELVPTSAYAHHWISICYLRLGDPERALREAEGTLAVDPRFSDARVLRGGVLAARGDYPAAIAELRKAVDTDPAKVILRLDLAKVLAEAGRPGDAEAEYDAIFRLQPDYAPALAGAGALYASTGRLDDAVRVLRRAVDVEPNQLEARMNLAEAFARQGRAADAAAEWQRVIDAPHAPPAMRNAARARLARLR
jgi:arylsulfatase A-like enzyme/Tfp pilus assembly protein PilF